MAKSLREHFGITTFIYGKNGEVLRPIINDGRLYYVSEKEILRLIKDADPDWKKRILNRF